MKKKVHIFDILVLAILIVSLYVFATHEVNSKRRHQEQMHVQDSINARYQYVIDYHFDYCKLDTNEKYKPFGN